MRPVARSLRFCLLICAALALGALAGRESVRRGLAPEPGAARAGSEAQRLAPGGGGERQPAARGEIAGIFGGQGAPSSRKANPREESPTPAPAPPSGGSPRQTPIVHLAQRISPAVVSIGAVRTTYEVDPFFQDFFAPYFSIPRKTRQPYVGSGFIVDSNGLVVTNWHVIEGAERVFVTLPDGREFAASLVDADPFSDVALLRVEAKGLPSVEFGDSDSLMIGETVAAFGNPFGNYIEDPRPTITVGVVSALKRSFRPDPARKRVYLDMIQTDAAINPGNSGGPLVTLDEKVIGMNAFIVSTSGGSVGLGFAIPSNRVKGIVDEILQYGRLRPLLRDFFYVSMNPRLARYLGVPMREGALVHTVVAGGPAEKAGLREGDILVKANGQAIRTQADLDLQIAARQVGEVLELEAVRGDQIIKSAYTIQEAR